MKGSRYSEKVEALPSSKIQIDFSKLKADDVLSLSIGEPDFETPYDIEQAGINALQNGFTFYSDDRGLPELRKEIAHYLERHYKLSYDPASEILVSVGASEAIDLAFRALINPGDEVLLPTPSYISYAPLAQLAGADVTLIPLSAEHGFRLQAKDLEKAITPKSKLLILNYPHNPTGAILEKKDLEAIAKVVIKHDLLVLSDEIYAELTYGKKPCSIAAIPGMKERTLYVSGFSKAFAMTGWRLGYVCAPNEILSRLRKIHQYAMLACPTVSQYGAIEALQHTEESTEEMRQAYDKRRVYLLRELRAMGLDCFTPEGAFYVFPDIRKSGLSSDAFVSQLFEKEKLLLIPGTGFGAAGEGYVRISYAYSLPQLNEGMKRLKRFLAGLPKSR